MFLQKSGLEHPNSKCSLGNCFQILIELEGCINNFRLGTGYSNARVTLIEGWVNAGDLESQFR